jgi:very-short-patch-repair endonuclease
MTACEQALWIVLRAKRLRGWKFRRQEPIARYIADFVCMRARLIVELDGGQHLDRVEHDQVRDAWLTSQGFRVLRFWNCDWRENGEGVLRVIDEALGECCPSPQPLPHEGGGEDSPLA